MTTATRSDLDELKRRIPLEEYFRRNGSTQDAEGRWRCPCSARHTNGDAHHSVTIANGRARCWSQNCFGDKGADIFSLVGIVEQLADFTSQKRRAQELAGVRVDGARPARQILRRFRYRDGRGHEAWKLRWNTDEPGQKCTWAQDPDGLIKGKGDCAPTLYELERVMAVSRVMDCEGERDADTINAWLAALGLLNIVATTTPNGAGDVKAKYLQPLHGKAQVWLSGDNDEPGRSYVQKCGAVLRDHVTELRYVAVPEGFKDWTEWQDSGVTAQDFKSLLDAAPLWTTDAQQETTPNEAREQAGDDRPELDCDEGDLDALTTQAWQIVAGQNRPELLYRRGTLAVRLETDEHGRARLVELTDSRLRYEVARLARCTKSNRSPFGGHALGREDCKPPLDLIRNMLAAPSSEIPLPLVRGIVEVPVVSQGGVLIQTPGYDRDSQLIYRPYDPTVPITVPPRPTSDDLTGARNLLDELLIDFPFASNADRTNHIGTMILLFVRHFIQGSTPLALYEAPGPGTGKGLLVETSLYPAVGANVGTIADARDDDEMRKRITARLLEGCAVTLFDNITRPVDSGVISAAITAHQWEDRRLGKTETLSLPVSTIWVMTANNPTLSVELARRAVRIRLDAKVDQPWLRDGFRHPNLKEWVHQERAPLIRALLTLVQGWLAADAPAPSTPLLGSFESWSRVVGGILEYAGYTEFLGNALAFYDTADTDGATWRIFTESWWTAHQDQPVSVKDLFPIAEGLDGLYLGKAANERGQRSALGRHLTRRRDQVVGIYRIEAAGTSNNAALWRLRRPETDSATRQEMPVAPAPVEPVTDDLLFEEDAC